MKIHVEKMKDNFLISLNENGYQVMGHDFWPRLPNWEPETLEFFKKYLLKGTDYLDIGAWIGPTALLATALGARKIKAIEPNPINFLHLVSTQANNGLMQKWSLINACISDTRTPSVIGPINGILHASSATNIIDRDEDGVEIISLKIKDLLQASENYSLVKVDIEGAEQYIIDDLSIFSTCNAAVWLSLHPPFIANKYLFLQKLLDLQKYFYFTDSNNCKISSEQLSLQFLSDVEKPNWGTVWGNFFEIGLLPKEFFNISGKRK
tara:strand:+ start:671 stop:1465 length:795 start_codon:yes stop_codon:yes gene_type:complete